MFAQRLKALRKARKLSQRALAAILNVSQQTVAKWETDGATPNPDMLNKIADFFCVSVDYLTGRTNERSSGLEPELDGLEGIDFAFMGDYNDLTEMDKQTIREMARLLKERGKQ